MKNLTLLLISLLPAFVFAQRTNTSLPTTIIYKDEALLSSVNTKADKDIMLLNGEIEDRFIRKEVKEDHRERAIWIKKIIESGVVVQDERVNAYYQHILNTILKANPQISSDIKLLVVRYGWPNAVCYGNGILMINLGLVEKFENESQIAFVIGHEIAHQYNDHVNKAILKRAADLNSEQIKLGLKDVEREKEGSKTALLNLLKSSTFDFRKHSRLHETEADSFALCFLLNTPYDYTQSARTMDILDSCDKDLFSRSILSFRWFFDSLTIPYKYSWEYYNGKSSLQLAYIKEDFMVSDSMKTHPDCKDRKVALLRQAQRLPQQHSKALNVQGDSMFRYQLHASYTDIVYQAYIDSNYALSFYNAMEMAQIYPDDAFPHMIISLSLAELNMHSRNRTMGKVLNLPRYSEDNAYDRTVAFLNELSRNETAALGYYYLRKNVGEITPSNEEYVYAMYITSLAYDKADEAKQYKLLYETTFKTGKYKNKINQFHL